MRKYISIFLMITFVFGLCGCNSQKSDWDERGTETTFTQYTGLTSEDFEQMAGSALYKQIKDVYSKSFDPSQLRFHISSVDQDEPYFYTIKGEVCLYDYNGNGITTKNYTVKIVRRNGDVFSTVID